MHNLAPKKKFGQNFLTDQSVIERIVSSAGQLENKSILEIGGGSGNLTKHLIKAKPKDLIVVEIDKDYIEILGKIMQNSSIKTTLISDDILKTDIYSYFSEPPVIFGNLPYNVSTKILISFIKVENLNKKFGQFIFVFQKEVADRIVAKYNTKEYGRLSILSTWKMEKLKIFDIPPRSFYPVPKVWSSLIKFVPKKNIVSLKKPKNLEHVTNIFFNQKRKMIKKPMKQLFQDFENTAKKLDIDLNLRPQNLSVNKFIEICKLYEN